MKSITANDMAWRNAEAGRFWFSPSSMGFFASKVETPGYLTEDRSAAYFVSSEQFIDREFRAARKYTVRRFTLATADVETVGKFQQYSLRSDAVAAAQDLATGRIAEPVS